MEEHRFRREALALVALLCAGQAAMFFLSSERGLRFFAVAEPVADLGSLASDLPGAGQGPLVLAPAGAEPTIARLGAADLEPGSTYLLTVRAAAGLPFGIQALARDVQQLAWKSLFPRRAESELFTRALAAPEGVRSLRFEIWNTTSLALRVEELRIQRLRPAHGLIWRLLRPAALVLLALFAVRHRGALGDYLGGRGGAERERRGDRLVAALVLLVCFHLFLDAPSQQLIDAKYSTAVSQQLLTRGSLYLPRGFIAGLGEEIPYQLQPVEGGLVHLYPNAPAVLNVPFVAVYSALGLAPVGPGDVFLRHREHSILVVAAAFQAAVVCALLFLLARVFLRPAASLVLTGVFASGTQILTTLSRSYWSHTWAVLLLTAAMYLLLAPAWRDRTRSYVLAATCLSWSFFCRPTMSLSIVGLTVLVLLVRRRHFPAFALTGLAWAALFAVLSLAIYDRPLPPYYLSAYVESGTLAADRLMVNFPRALVGTLVSPRRGLLVYLPFLPLLLVLVAAYWRRLSDKTLAATGLAVVVAHWLVICTNMTWVAGGFGPRLFADVLIWFFVLSAMVIAVWRAPSGSRRWLRRLVVATAIVLAAASVLLHVRGVYARGRIAWDGYSFWDWRQPFFLGRQPPRPAAPSLADRVAELESEPDPGERKRLFDELVRSESLPERQIDGRTVTARAVTWDHWTYGTSPGFVQVVNPTAEAVTPRLGLASWAPREVYPITVSVGDGETESRYVLAARGAIQIELPRVPARSARIYVVRSDKGWSPGGGDQRVLGVKLRAAEGEEEGAG